ncbi:MAG: DUF1553 domain-containing protein [Planctomycetota bacterium]|nr:DUF1553 domain-containing protein [Planctomycetota bacterium]
MSFRFSLLLLVVSGPLSAASAAPPVTLSPADTELFEKKIRPVLVQHCYSCHSERAAQNKQLRGGLRLDSRAGVRKGGDSGPSIVAGKPAGSLLLQALRYETLEMPPDGALPASVIADFQLWIARGAPDPRGGATVTKPRIDLEEGRLHWAYRPIEKPQLPRTAKALAGSPIDTFINARREAAELPRAPQASRLVLVRRLYFDLIGIPPTPAQIESFLRDNSPDANERLVSQLLASPRFGERWGRHWLDVVRFAESITLRGFLFPEAWRYRDYVIDAWNNDLPFDRFIREQLAGDLLPAASLEQQQQAAIATTVLTLGNNNLEDQDKAKLRMDVVDEQLETISRGFLAQTIGCARCHDHKFDPIPTRDYYALAGILRNTRTLKHANVSKWIELPLPVAADRAAELRRWETEAAALKKQIAQLKTAAQGGRVPLPLKQLAGIVVDDQQAEKTGSWMASQSVKSYVGIGYQHDRGEGKGEKTATFLAKLPANDTYEVRFAYTPGQNRSSTVPITVHHVDGQKTILVNQKKVPAIEGHFVSLGRYRFARNTKAKVVVDNRGTTDVVIIDAVQFLPRALADKKPDVTTKPQPTSPELLSRLEKQLQVLTAKTTARPKYMSVQEETQIEDTHIHIRGNVHTLGTLVPRGFLQVATIGPQPTVPQGHSGRRELADWIAGRTNPLTARVLVNRLWQWLFGFGLVRTPDNFGRTGGTPSHPRLLDYLAARSLERDWSVKSLLREMVLSQTYQLSSQSFESGTQLDPENILLWRMHHRRLDAESLLDAMLTVNGSLRGELGGPTIRTGTANDYGYQHGGERRAVYWPVLRNSLPQIFELFDFANPSMVTGKRDISNTAPQALFLMNNPWVLQQAERAADHFLRKKQLDDAQRLRYVFLAAVGRPPEPAEARAMLEFLTTSDQDKMTRQLRWTQVIHALFGSIDFRYLP